MLAFHYNSMEITFLSSMEQNFFLNKLISLILVIALFYETDDQFSSFFFLIVPIPFNKEYFCWIEVI